MTYRVHGVLGIASRHKKRLRKETADLAMVIAGLIGTALNKADLYRESQMPVNTEPSPHQQSPQELVTPQRKIPLVADKPAAPQPPPEENAAKPAENPFHKHAHKMKTFRSLHH
jgi:cytoskeletal protein RodZ